MSRARLLVLALAVAVGSVLVRRFLEQQQASEPIPEPHASQHTGAPSDANGGTSATPRAELYAEAQRLGVKGRSKMNKAELAAAVAAARQGEGA